MPTIIKDKNRICSLLMHSKQISHTSDNNQEQPAISWLKSNCEGLKGRVCLLVCLIDYADFIPSGPSSKSVVIILIITMPS